MRYFIRFKHKTLIDFDLSGSDLLQRVKLITAEDVLKIKNELMGCKLSGKLIIFDDTLKYIKRNK